MAETIISPGVFTRENDISFIQPAPVAAGAAIIGPTVKGPVEVPTLVTSYNDYARRFGVTFESGSNSYEYLTSLAVKNYFQQGGNSVLVSRVVSGSFTRAENTNISSLNRLSATTELSASVSTLGAGMSASAYTNIPLTGGTAGVDAVATVTVDGATSISSIEVTTTGYEYVVGETITIPSASLGASAGGGTDPVITLTAGNLTSVVNSFEIQTSGKGTIYNNSTGPTDGGAQNSDSSLVSGSADNIRWEVSNINNAQGTFTLSVRQGDDNLKNKIVLETFNNLSLDPNSGNYIEKVIGTQYQELTTDADGSKYIRTFGEYVNRSNYIRVSAVNRPTLNYLGTDGITINSDSNGLNFKAALPIASSGSLYDASGDLNPGANFFGNINSTNTQGLDPSTDYANIISVLENTDDYQFNIISSPGLVYELTNHGTQIDSIISLAETRGDCIAVVDLVEYNDTVGGVTAQSTNLNSSYAASYWPWLQMQSATGKNEWVPASVVIPGVYAFTDNSSAPWFAPAGLVRGGITGVIQAERRLTRTQRDTLYTNKVNPIASFPGQGISVFGQKTLQTKASALDRVNVRRLLIELKKFIGDQSRNLVFEQNTITTRNRFLATVNPYLESVVQRQGLYAYRVVMDDTNNTADVVDRNQLIGQIFIQPAKTAEFIILDFTIEPTGATFAG
jgi:uncharacterized protein